MEEYDIRTRTSSVGAACALVVIASNLISLVTTGIGLKESFFEEKTVLNLLFVGGLSLVIQLTKAALDRLPKKGVKLTCIYVVALVLSSLFSAQSMVLAAYPAERFAAAAQQTLSSAYTEQLLGIQGAVWESLTAARDDLWSDLEAVRASLDTGESSLDAEKMLAKYRETSDGFDPMSDTSYLALEAALEDVANKDFETAKSEVDNALAVLDAEDNEIAKAKVAQEIEQIVQQKKRNGLTAEQTDALSAQLTNAIQRQAALTARAEGHQRIRSDLQRVQNSLEKGTTLAAKNIDQLEKTLLQKEQDPAQLRTLLDTALNNADVGMDMKSSAGLREALEEYISLLDTNTAIGSRIAALDDTDAAADAENWQGVWSERLNSLHSEVATSKLAVGTKTDEIQDIDKLLRRYATSHSPLEFMAVCLISKGNGLAIVCVVLALLLDLAGMAANIVALNLYIYGKM